MKKFNVKVYDSQHLRNLNKRLRRVLQLLDEVTGKAVGIGVKNK